MKTVTVLEDQQLIDIAMQELGDVARVFELAVIKGMAITDSLNAGETIDCPDYDTDKVNEVNVFSDRSLYPASGWEDPVNSTLPPGGIGFMEIGRNFLAS